MKIKSEKGNNFQVEFILKHNFMSPKQSVREMAYYTIIIMKLLVGLNYITRSKPKYSINLVYDAITFNFKMAATSSLVMENTTTHSLNECSAAAAYSSILFQWQQIGQSPILYMLMGTLSTERLWMTPWKWGECKRECLRQKVVMTTLKAISDLLLNIS